MAKKYMETFTLQAYVYRTQNIGHCTTEIALYSKSMSAQYAIADHTRKTFFDRQYQPFLFPNHTTIGGNRTISSLTIQRAAAHFYLRH